MRGRGKTGEIDVCREYMTKIGVQVTRKARFGTSEEYWAALQKNTKK